MPRDRVRWVLVALSVVVYALMWVGFAAHWSWIAAMDNWALTPMHTFGLRHPGWVTFWDVFCTVFGPLGFRLLGVGLMVVAWLQHNRRAALFVLIAVECSGLATLLAKSLADRPRPVTKLVDALDSSFPSGHSVAVMAAVLAVLVLISGVLRPRARVFAAIVGAVIIVAIGVGRVILNVHHPSDVLAGWALGYVFFAVSFLLIRPEPLRRRAIPEVAEAVIADGEAAGTPVARGSSS